tara:strand:- start:3782 stop:4090 length:309 start_codon:yes stop_codon:yes gene_type:complete
MHEAGTGGSAVPGKKMAVFGLFARASCELSHLRVAALLPMLSPLRRVGLGAMRGIMFAIGVYGPDMVKSRCDDYRRMAGVWFGEFCGDAEACSAGVLSAAMP